MVDVKYNDDEVWELHLIRECPYDCPFCFDEDVEDGDYFDPWEESDYYESLNEYGDYSNEEEEEK